MHARADMGPHKRAVIGLESRAISARATKHFVTIFSKTCNKTQYDYGKCSKISNTLKLQTPKIIAENNF